MKLSIILSTLLSSSLHATIKADGHMNPITERHVFAQTGEVTTSSAMVNVRCNDETDSRVYIEYCIHARQGLCMGVEDVAMAATDYTVSIMIPNLLAHRRYEYRVKCEPMDGSDAEMSRRNTFFTAPDMDDDVTCNFVWVADLAGQGWGRNPELKVTSAINGETVVGGYGIFEIMRQLTPDFAIFQGDMIYADNVIPPTKMIPESVGGGEWINNPYKNFTAITLDEFRANWKYNFGDEWMATFLEEVPIYTQWDDHEVTNNWYPREIMGEGEPYNGIAANELYVNSLIAYYENNPIQENELLYRSQVYGKHMEVFFVDMRSYRDDNPDNYNADGIAMMGPEQTAWLKEALAASTATWKILSMHDPIGLVTGGETDRDSWGQGEPEMLGREVELAEVLSFIKANDIKNVVSLTSDVHFAAAIKYDPERAPIFKDFNPFYEFVIGPINAGAFGPNMIDPSLGGEFEFVWGPGQNPELGMNLPPPNYQNFGYAVVERDGTLRINIRDITGAVIYGKVLEPEM